MATDDERREAAERLRAKLAEGSPHSIYESVCYALGKTEHEGNWDVIARLADLVEPSYKPDAKYEAWYNSLSHYGDKRGGPSTIRELIEEIVWTALTVDLGPNGNTDPSTGIDEGGVYTNKLFAEWDREALRLSGCIDRAALLDIADECDMMRDDGLPIGSYEIDRIARRIREALGVSDD